MIEIRPCRPEEEQQSWNVEAMVWNPFNGGAEGSVNVDYFPDLHFVAVEDGLMLGTIDGCPFDWDGTVEGLPPGGWRDMVLASIPVRAGAENRARWVGAIGTSIRPGHGRRGISQMLLRALLGAAREQGYLGVAAPVRPVFRARVPGLDTLQYSQLRLPDGRHFDPWLRAHEEIGGEIIGTCENSAFFRAPREMWEKWAKMGLPENGEVLFPDAIAPLKIEDGEGLLVEPSVWVLHRSEKKSEPGGPDGPSLEEE